MLRSALVVPVLVLALSSALLACLAVSSYAMPLRPDVVERLRAEGRLPDEARVMKDAHSRGVNQPSPIQRLL